MLYRARILPGWEVRVPTNEVAPRSPSEARRMVHYYSLLDSSPMLYCNATGLVRPRGSE